jgi:hypothetical protein
VKLPIRCVFRLRHPENKVSNFGLFPHFLSLIFMANFHGCQTTPTTTATSRASAQGFTLTLSGLPSSSQGGPTYQTPPTSTRPNRSLRQASQPSPSHQAPHAGLRRGLNSLHSPALPHCPRPRLLSLQLPHQRLLQGRVPKGRRLLLSPNGPREYFAVELYFHIRDQSVRGSFGFETW